MNLEIFHKIIGKVLDQNQRSVKTKDHYINQSYFHSLYGFAFQNILDDFLFLFVLLQKLNLSID